MTAGDTQKQATKKIAKPGNLEELLQVFHPNYIPLMIRLTLISLLGGVLVYFQNTLLHGLVSTLTDQKIENQLLLGLTEKITAFSEISPVFAVLALLCVVAFGLATSALRKAKHSGGLYTHSTNDLEREILNNLLHQKSGFYSDNSIGEIVTRLSIDLKRVNERRMQFVDGLWASLLIAGNLYFFFTINWVIALFAVLISLLGAFVSSYIGKDVKDADMTFFIANDKVKGKFQDILNAVPEVQVTKLFPNALSKFDSELDTRNNAFHTFDVLNMRFDFSETIWPSLGFVLMIIVLMFIGKPAETTVVSADLLPLIPVFVWAVPSLFSNSVKLVNVWIKFQLAGNSLNRIVEYSAPSGRVSEQQKKEISDLTITFDKATHRFINPLGLPQGGISDISTTLKSGSWTAVIGGSGAGKSTFAEMLLSRIKPQSGALTFLDKDGSELDPDKIEQFQSIMPQQIAVFDDSIEANLLFGVEHHEDADSILQQKDAALLLEEVGLTDLSLKKSLQVTPQGDCQQLENDIGSIRQKVKHSLEAEGFQIVSFSEGGYEDRAILLEVLMKGRLDMPRLYSNIANSANTLAWLKPIPDLTTTQKFIQQAITILDETESLLSVTSIDKYNSLSPYEIDESIWLLRRRCAEFKQKKRLSKKEKSLLVLTALTTQMGELFEAGLEKQYISDLQQSIDGQKIWTSLCANNYVETYDSDKLNHFLNWRDNLLFGVVHTNNHRQNDLIDEILDGFVSQDKYRKFFSKQGLMYHVGRDGSRLSGGQCQLIAFCRAMLRMTPLLVLDEPTSALNPASRDRVARAIRANIGNRVIVTITHDMEFITHADTILVIDNGKLVDSGTFDEIVEGEAFKRVVTS